MCLCVHNIWKTWFLLLILHKLLNKSKITALSLLLTLAVLCQAEINSQSFGVGTILWCVSSEPLYYISAWFIPAEMQYQYVLMSERQPTSAPGAKQSTVPLEGTQSISFTCFPKSRNIISLPQKPSSLNVSVLVQTNGGFIPALLSQWSPLGGKDYLWLTYYWFSVVGCPTEHLFLFENTRVLLKLINSAVGGDY